MSVWGERRYERLIQDNSLIADTKSLLEVNDHELKVKSIDKVVYFLSIKYSCGEDPV